MTKLKFGSILENVVTRKEFPLKKAKQVLKNEIIAILGYGVQGPAQALNLRDNNFNVIVGQRKNSKSYKKAISDGWREGKTLFDLEKAAKRGTILCFLLSDAGQIAVWPTIKRHLTKRKTLYFSHGFGITYRKHTGIIPPKDIDVILIAPKGAGRTVRKHFLENRGINSSFAVFQDASGHAQEKVLAMGIGIGSGYLFETTFEKEVYSDLTGERGVLMGALTGIMEAQYNTLIRHGHSPSEAFNETVEELTQSLIPLISENGMDWMYANTSTTAQRGALDWRHIFRKAVEPVFERLYKRVKNGIEARSVIKANSRKDYKQKLEKELSEMRNSEMWKAGVSVRSLRPENQAKRK